jgi:DNA-binding IclR family transcriptional regulator
MDFRRPVQAVIPGARGRILAVLADTTADLNLRTIARLSGVSAAQASRVLPELVSLGMVDRREAPPSALFRLVHEHVASRMVRSLTRARETVLEELGHHAEALSPQPTSVIVFGSFAVVRQTAPVISMSWPYAQTGPVRTTSAGAGRSRSGDNLRAA